MSDHFFALLVHGNPSTFDSLKTTLKDLSVGTYTVESLAEAKHLIPRTHPHIVFTDTSLPDGSWSDVINLAEKAGSPVNVIVVGSNKDMNLYMSAIERGAFDFVLPPFEHDALDFAVRSAGENACHRRHVQARLAVA